jgi:hypothetical protein
VQGVRIALEQTPESRPTSWTGDLLTARRVFKAGQTPPARDPVPITVVDDRSRVVLGSGKALECIACTGK